MLRNLVENDEGRERRQVGIVDARGGAATFTGTDCHAWAGGQTGVGYAAQGNLLTGPKVIQAMVTTFEQTRGSLAERLLAALAAGDTAGGDRRRRQSAALLVVREKGGYGGYTDRFVDLRVDDHPDPVKELARLYRIWQLYFLSPEPSQRRPLTGSLLVELQQLSQALGYYRGPAHGQWDAKTQAAYALMIGNENFEERIPFNANWIDEEVLAYLRERVNQLRSRTAAE